MKRDVINIGEMIKREVDAQGITVKWLSDSLNCSRYNIYNIFSRTTIDTELLYRISKLLKKNFFEPYIEHYEDEMYRQDQLFRNIH